MSASRAGTQKVGWLLKAWHEHPDLVASCGIGIFGTFLTGGALAYFQSIGYDRMHQHHFRYMVIREEDADPKKIGDIYN